MKSAKVFFVVSAVIAIAAACGGGTTDNGGDGGGSGSSGVGGSGSGSGVTITPTDSGMVTVNAVQCPPASMPPTFCQTSQVCCTYPSDAGGGARGGGVAYACAASAASCP